MQRFTANFGTPIWPFIWNLDMALKLQAYNNLGFLLFRIYGVQFVYARWNDLSKKEQPGICKTLMIE